MMSEAVNRHIELYRSMGFKYKLNTPPARRLRCRVLKDALVRPHRP
jgi:hypothetical protein